MRRKLGAFLMILGLLSVLASAGLVLHNRSRDRQAGQAAAVIVPKVEQRILRRQEAVQAELTAPAGATVPEQTVTLEMPVEEIDGLRYIGCLSMPAIGRELPVIAELEMPLLRTAPCRYCGSTYTDNLVIAAHNYNRHFGPISDLMPGDPVYFTDMDGITTAYVVADTRILMPTDVDKAVSSGADLTLFTCTYGGAGRVAVRCNRTAGP